MVRSYPRKSLAQWQPRLGTNQRFANSTHTPEQNDELPIHRCFAYCLCCVPSCRFFLFFACAGRRVVLLLDMPFWHFGIAILPQPPETNRLQHALSWNQPAAEEGLPRKGWYGNLVGNKRRQNACGFRKRRGRPNRGAGGASRARWHSLESSFDIPNFGVALHWLLLCFRGSDA